MRYTLVLVTAVFAVVLLAGIGGQAAQKSPVAAQPGVSAPDTVIFEDVWVYFADKPEEQMLKARVDFDKKDFAAAAKDVGTASAYVKVESGRASGAAQEAIRVADDQLDALAAQIGTGVVPSGTFLDQVFGRVHYTLANAHYLRAKREWSHQNFGQTAPELEEAVTHYQHAKRWLGEQIVAETASTLETVHGLAGKLGLDQPVAKADMERELARLKIVLDNLGKEFQPVTK
jgi:hypothetical protein